MSSPAALNLGSTRFSWRKLIFRPVSAGRSQEIELYRCARCNSDIEMLDGDTIHLTEHAAACEARARLRAVDGGRA